MLNRKRLKKLLRCIYSNRNPSWLLKEDILLRDLVQILEPTWLKEQSTFDQQETTIPVLDLNEQSEFDSDSDSDSDMIFQKLYFPIASLSLFVLFRTRKS